MIRFKAFDVALSPIGDMVAVTRQFGVGPNVSGSRGEGWPQRTTKMPFRQKKKKKMFPELFGNRRSFSFSRDIFTGDAAEPSAADGRCQTDERQLCSAGARADLDRLNNNPSIH